MSDLAQQRIEREKRERTGYLEIGNCGLTETARPGLGGENSVVVQSKHLNLPEKQQPPSKKIDAQKT